MLLRLSGGHGDAGQALDERHDFTVLIKDRAQLDIDMFGAARCVMDMQHPFRRATVPGLAHRAQLAGLIARHSVMMGNPMTFTADGGLAVNTELTLIGAVGSENVVVGIQDNGWLSVVLKIGHQRLYSGVGNISR
ncbi:hypothetical protein D3C78_880520 [compost metagenome]